NTTLAPGVEPHLEWVTDIPGCGDTAFPSIVRIDEHTYLIVNYTSPTDLCADWPWLEGQIAPQGTSIYVIVVSFMALEGWMKFVIQNRDKLSMVEAMKSGGSQDARIKSMKHLGFNMFEELGFTNYFIANGAYKVNWGTRYFAELVNPIPRALWPGKPEIGTDYAIARGMGYGENTIAGTVSTGMIGQGVVNFGRILGPIAAAFLMAIWVAVLARQDLMGHDIGHLLLYAIGLVLTFNMGRDITLLVLYPFIFGWLLLWWNNRRNKAKS
ncbi:MAG: hypothetical protein EBZ48_18035, partial [Proteobacteria bacterium]|nr:hypothetical protein [Pseudomonadota bacterium]